MKQIFQKLNKPAFSGFLSVLLLAGVATAGSLSPSASPASTFNTLAEIYNSIASTFDSSAISASQNGSLLQHLKYIEANLSNGPTSNSLDFDELVNAMTVDANSTVTGGAFSLTFDHASISSNFEVGGIASVSNLYIGPVSSSAAFGAAQLNVSLKVPTTILSEITISSPFGHYVQGNYAYVTSNNTSSVKIFDISNPASASSVSSITTNSSPQFVSVQGRYLYVTAGGGGATLQIFDVANPKLPALAGSVTLGSLPRTFYVQGRYAYVGNYNAGTLQIVDVSNPSAPVIVSTTATTFSNPFGVYVQGRYVYVAGFTGTSGFQIFDVSNPAAPVSMSTTATGGINPQGIWVQGRYAYVPDASAFEIYDISNPTAPTLTGSVAIAGGVDTLWLQGRYAYTLDSAFHLVVIDVTRPSAPAIVGLSSTISGFPRYVSIQGRYAYVTNQTRSRFQVFDLGGGYIQQLETGGLQAASIDVRNNIAIANDADIRGALTIGRGLNVTGPFSITSSISGYNTFRFNPEGGVSVSAAFELGSYASLSNTLWVSPPGKSGNVGIGTAAPGALLDVKSTATASVNGQVALRLVGSYTSSTVGSGPSIDFFDGTATTAGRIRSYHTNTSGRIGLLIETYNSGAVHTAFFDGNGNASISNSLFTTYGANVGIGTAAPGAKLTVRTDAAVSVNGQEALRIMGNYDSAAVGSGPFIQFSDLSNGATGRIRSVHQSVSGNVGMSFETLTASAVTERMRISAEGNVGIGATTPEQKLEVGGSIEASGSAGFIIRSTFTTQNVASISATSLTTGTVLNMLVPTSGSQPAVDYFVVKDTAGQVYASLGAGGSLTLRRQIFNHGATENCTSANTPAAGCIDYAEEFPTTDQSLAAGEVVMLDPSNSAHVLRATTSALGIVSTNPGSLLTGKALLGGAATQNHTDGTVPVALAGRVPVKISGPVSAGDHLTVSDSVPGSAMKQTESGMSLGIALESSESGSVMALVTTSYWAPSVSASSDGITSVDPESWEWTSVMHRIQSLFATLWNITIEEGLVKAARGVFGRVQADSLQMKDSATGETYCVTITNGEFTKVPGGCDNAPAPATSLTPSPAPEVTPEQSPESSPTPEITPTPAPETPTPDVTPTE
jgi:hypothetical protein